MYKIAIVEDDPAQAENLRQLLMRFSSEKKKPMKIEAFPDSYRFLSAYKGGYDIVFMDIDMPGINGMEAAGHLRKMDDVVCLIFVTNLAQYALQGYEVSAKYYLLKPVRYADFAFKMEKVFKELPDRSAVISIDAKDGFLVIPLAEILYIESYGHKLVYHTVNGEHEVWNHTLKQVEEELKGNGFVRCSSSHVINLRYLKQIGKNTVTVGKDVLPVSRSRKKPLLEVCGRYFAGSPREGKE